MYGALIESAALLDAFCLRSPPANSSIRGILLRRGQHYVCGNLENMVHELLTDPAVLLRLPFADCSKMQDLLRQRDLPPVALPPVHRAGTAHALAVWWELELDAAGHRVSSAPGQAASGGHWQQSLWALPRQGLEMECGQHLRVRPSIFPDRLEYEISGHETDIQDPGVSTGVELSVPADDMVAMNRNAQWSKLQVAIAVEVDSVLVKCPTSTQVGRRLWILEITSGLLPVGAVMAVREFLQLCSKVEQALPPMAGGACVVRHTEHVLAAASAFLEANLLESIAAHFFVLPCTPMDIMLTMLPPPEPFAGAPVLLVCADVVLRDGRLRHGFLEEVLEAHQRVLGICVLHVVPNELELWLTPIMSVGLARRSCVLWGPEAGDGTDREEGLSLLGLDVRGLDVLGVPSFYGLSEAELCLHKLGKAQMVLTLPMRYNCLQQILGDMVKHRRRMRLGPLVASGVLHGVLCEWRWSASRQVLQATPPQLEFAGILWSTHQGSTAARHICSAVKEGDHLELELRYSHTAGVLVTPLSICQARPEGMSTGVPERERRVEEDGEGNEVPGEWKAHFG